MPTPEAAIIPQTAIQEEIVSLSHIAAEQDALLTMALTGMYDMQLIQHKNTFNPFLKIDCEGFVYGLHATYWDLFEFQITPGARKIEKPVYGSLAFYWNRSPVLQGIQDYYDYHIGIVTPDGNLISKWGDDHVLKHPLHIVPPQYGSPELWTNPFSSTLNGYPQEFLWLPHALHGTGSDINFTIKTIYDSSDFLEAQASRFNFIGANGEKRRALMFKHIVHHQPNLAPGLIDDVINHTQTSRLFDVVVFAPDLTVEGGKIRINHRALTPRDDNHLKVIDLIHGHPQNDAR